MVTPELLAYIRGELAKGKSRDEIKAALLQGGGWIEKDLEEAFISLEKSITQIPNPVSENINSSKNILPVSEKKSSSKNRFRGGMFLVIAIAVLTLVSSLLQGGANISGILKSKSLPWVLLGLIIWVIGYYWRYKREVSVEDGKVKKTNFLILFLKTMSWSWTIAPFFVNAGAWGGKYGPVPGVYFLIPIFGQVVAFNTFVTHPILLFCLWALFGFFLTSTILLSRKVTEKKIIRILFVIALIGLYWIVAKALFIYIP